jgi:hypothetical protein
VNGELNIRKTLDSILAEAGRAESQADEAELAALQAEANANEIVAEVNASFLWTLQLHFVAVVARNCKF